MSKINLTTNGQCLKWFKVKTDVGGGKPMHEQIMEYAIEHNLIIDQIDYNWSAKPIYAYVLFHKKEAGICAECHGECSVLDYLCDQCRT